MIDIQIVLTYLTLISIPVGVFYHILTLYNTRKNQQQQLETRQAQLFMSIYNRTNEVEFWENFIEIQQWEWESFEEYNEKYRNRKETRAVFNSIGTYFEGMGVMVKRNLIDVTIVDDLVSGPLMSLWEKYEPIILEDRKRRNMPTIWEWFEFIYSEVKKVSVQEHGSKHVIDVSRLERTINSKKKNSNR